MKLALRFLGRRDEGVALLVVLIFLLAIGTWSASFLWFMNQQQARAGARYRSAAAMRLAEAGVHRALSILESRAPDGSPGRAWRSGGHTEELYAGALPGRFTIRLQDEADGAVTVVSTGEAGGVTRRLQARVYLAAPALLAGLYGAHTVRLQNPPAATVILPYGAGLGGAPWIHLAAGREVWFATTQVSINDPAARFEAGPGPLDPPESPDRAVPLPRPGPVRILLPPGGELTLDKARQRVDVQQLRVMGIYVEGVIVRTEAFPLVPEVDTGFYQGLAAANTSNAELNEAAGTYLGDGDLIRKRDSLYSQKQFEQLQAYQKARGGPQRLRGVVYVTGLVSLLSGERLHIADGALITASTVHLSEGAELVITHGAASRALPGLIVLGNGALFVTEGARLRVHGLVYSSRTIDIGQGAQVDVVGSVLGKEPGLSFFNRAATIVIRYDPAVLGTPGLRVPQDAPVIAWVAAWEELPPTPIPQVAATLPEATPAPLRTLLTTPSPPSPPVPLPPAVETEPDIDPAAQPAPSPTSPRGVPRPVVTRRPPAPTPPPARRTGTPGPVRPTPSGAPTASPTMVIPAPPPAPRDVNEAFVLVVIGPISDANRAAEIAADLTVTGYSLRLNRREGSTYFITLGPYRRSVVEGIVKAVRARFGVGLPVVVIPAP